MSVSVIGAGRWGTFLGWYLATYKKENVIIYGLEEAISFQELKNNRKNDFLSLPDNVSMSSNLDESLKSDFIVISIEAQQLKVLAQELQQKDIKGKTFLLAMKGLDIENKARLTKIMKKYITQDIEVAVLLGPGHVQDYLKGVLNCAVIDSESQETKVRVSKLMESDLVRVYYGVDLIGNEIGGAYKNVIGLCAGMLDALGWESVKGALMARSINEVSKFIAYYGGNPLSASGLAFLGDFQATLFSENSNNRMWGEKFVKGEKDFKKNAEGYYTLKAVYEMSRDANLETPITDTLYDIVYNNKDIKTTLSKLFGEDLKDEF
ncbi:MAG: NAD(P)H-dependent glycerol-3-phosphate dehydrogenase [Rickettsiales bacterium]|nr:MAG: NAD(P)H-dependent glycerol-3-phosphate dehydrogenase [Rickettsiales bacterium]